MATKPNSAPPRPARPAAPAARPPAEASDGTSLNPRAPGRTGPTEEAIRSRAYQLWEVAGRPEGDGVQFWLEAEQELRG